MPVRTACCSLRILREQGGFDGLVMSDWGRGIPPPGGRGRGVDLKCPLRRRDGPGDRAGRARGGWTRRRWTRCARVLRLALAMPPQRKKGVSRAVHNVKKRRCAACWTGNFHHAYRAVGERRAVEE